MNFLLHFNRHTISGYYHALTRMIMAFFDCYSHKTGCPLNCDFLTFRRGKLITLAALAKMARGRMARFLIDNRIREPEGLREFSWEGYEFSPEHSDGENFRFVQRF